MLKVLSLFSMYLFVEISVKFYLFKKHVFVVIVKDGMKYLETALNKETDLDLIQRPKDYEPFFVEQAKRYENMSRFLQELFLMICTRNDTHYDNLSMAEVINMKRYDVAYAIQKYHGGFGNVRTLFPNPPKPLTYWDDKDNVAKEVRRIMRLYDQVVMPHENQLIYSGNGWLKECIKKHGGFESFADYIHAETNWDEQLEEKDEKQYWDNLENIYDELMTFIYDTKIHFMPSRLELLAGGCQKLWEVLCGVAKNEYQTQLIRQKKKELKRKWKQNGMQWKLNKEEIADKEEIKNKEEINEKIKDLVVRDKEYYTKTFQVELDKELFKLKESKEFNKILNELDVMKNVSSAFNIPINKEFEGHCGFAKDAENEWKDFGALAKELMAFDAYYKDSCFTLNREYVDNFTLPTMEDIAYCMRADLNYAILRWHGGHKRVENKVRGMKLLDLYHPMYGKGKNRDEMLYLEHGTVWQFKALPPPPTPLIDDNNNLLIDSDGNIDPMFLPQALPTNDMIDPTAKIAKNKRLTKKIRDKKVTLLLT